MMLLPDDPTNREIINRIDALEERMTVIERMVDILERIYRILKWGAGAALLGALGEAGKLVVDHIHIH